MSTFLFLNAIFKASITTNRDKVVGKISQAPAISSVAPKAVEHWIYEDAHSGPQRHHEQELSTHISEKPPRAQPNRPRSVAHNKDNKNAR